MKKWLTDNKIFFEVLSTLLFGVASVYLAIAANTVSQGQLEVAKLELEPHIFVGEKYLIDETGIATETILEVTNAGAPAYNFSIDARTFYTVAMDRETIWIPVAGYYNATFKLNVVNGKLAEVRGVNNNSAFAKTYSQSFDSSKNGELGFTEILRVTIVRVSYETRSKDKSEQYFLGEKLSNDPWVKEVFQSHHTYWPLEINELDWSDIVEAALKIRDDAPVLVREGRFQ